MEKLSEDQISDILTRFERTTEHFLSQEEFRARLASGNQLRVKYGVDVKSPTIHLGHAVNLWLLRALQDLGHKIVIVFADFTSHVGDLDGRLDTISDLPPKEVEKNVAALLEQMGTILKLDDPQLCEIRRNSEWYARMSVQEIISLLSAVTHARLISRDEFQMRIAEGRELHMNELLYPVLQGYDSYRVGADVCVTASDQLFSESMGRLMQEKHKRRPQTVIATVMTPGLDGKTKQSHRRNNYVSLALDARDKFGRVMSIPDGLIETYFRVYTELPEDQFEELRRLILKSPRDAKIKLAELIVARYHGAEVAAKESEWFDSTISKGYIPGDLPLLSIPTHHIAAQELVALVRPGKSKSDTRRLIEQGGVELNGHKVKEAKQQLYLNSGDVLQAGRRSWYEIKIEQPPVFATERLLARALQVTDIPVILRNVPAADRAKFFVRFSRKGKSKDAAAEEALKHVVYNGDKRGEWMFALADKNNPDDVLGLVHMRGDRAGEPQNVWLSSALDDTSVEEIMGDLSGFALTRLDPNSEAFKRAFALANGGLRTREALYLATRQLDGTMLSKGDVPLGLPGFSHEEWDKFQTWRRRVTPSLFSLEDLERAGITNKPDALTPD